MTGAARPSWLRSRWAAALAILAALFFLLTVIPVVPWQARCYEEPVPEPYRPIFLKRVTAWLSQDDIYYWRIGDVILLRVVPLFDGKGRGPIIDDLFYRASTLLNIGKIQDMLEEDVTIDGVLYPKPPAVREVEQRPPGTYDRRDLCRAAIQLSPTDPPVP
jgi:hypothetical protein